MEAHRGSLSGSTKANQWTTKEEQVQHLALALMGPAAEILRGFDDSSEKALDDLWGRLRHRFGTVDECQQLCETSRVENLTASHWQNSSKSFGLCTERLGRTRLKNSAIQSSKDASKRESPLLNSDSICVFTTETLPFVRLRRRLGSSQLRWLRPNQRRASESPAPAIHHMAVPTVDFTPVLCRLDDIEKKFAGKWNQETDKAVSACISTPPRQDTTRPTAGRSQKYNSGRGSMPGRGRKSLPGRGGQSVRGRGTFQGRGGQEQTQPATPPPSPRLASQNNRLPIRGQIFFRSRGGGRGSVCWVCQREGCFSWNHPPLENREPPTPPPQD